MIDDNDDLTEFQKDLKFFHERLVQDSPNDLNARQKLRECVTLLGKAYTPDQRAEAFERYLSNPTEFMQAETERFLKECGTDATFGDLKDWQAAQNLIKGGHAE